MPAASSCPSPFPDLEMLDWKMHLCRSAHVLICFAISFHSLALSQIPLGSKLFVDDNNVWLSSNGGFAFGFFDHLDQPYLYSIGVRFSSKSIPTDKQTVVWVAGADIGVSNKSYFQLRDDGELVLFDASRGVPVWSSQTSQFSVVSAALFDDGNLVLLNAKKNIVWQSFDTPSDTLLPGQSLTVSQTLRAASNNSVSSFYTLFMNASGELQLKWETNIIYWTSGSHFSSNVSAIVTSDGALHLVNRNSKPLWSVYGEDHNDDVNYRFLRLDVDGNLRLYSWAEALMSWKTVWQAVQNQCEVFATCGEHGICVYNKSGSPYCKCPSGFTGDSNSRCLVTYPQECQSGSNMFIYENTYLYGIYPPIDFLVQTSLNHCKSICLSDQLCTASTYTNDGTGRCLIKRTPHVTGYSDPSQISVSFVKNCLDPLAVNPNSDLSLSSSSNFLVKQSLQFYIPFLIVVASCTVIALVIIQLGVGFVIYQRRKSVGEEGFLAYAGSNSKGLLVFSFSEIKELTGNFRDQVGPKMFKGVLSNNQLVAVKDLRTEVEERKFRVAVLRIGSIFHKNLLKLEGYCCETNHRFLIYEYVKNGSVEKYIKDPKLCKKLTWRKRLEICLSVAKAVCYLHTGCREFMSHGNLKCENVVLDEDLDVKVTEFGLGGVYREISKWHTSAEKDVVDFGKMVLITVSGCLETEDIIEWAYKEWAKGHMENVVDRRLDGGVELEELERSLRIAFWCVQNNERMRPSMGEVVKVLEGILNVDPPPPPFNWPTPKTERASLESQSS